MHHEERENHCAAQGILPRSDPGAPHRAAGGVRLRLREGDQFLYTGGAEMPAGFCPWAWIDLYRSVSALSCGASYTPWQRREGVNVVCCTDGLRPVTFLLEAQ